MDPEKKARFGKALQETRDRQKTAEQEKQKLSRTADPSRPKRRRASPVTEQP